MITIKVDLGETKMGVVYSIDEVSTGRVPDNDGTDHLEALRFYFDNLTDPEAPTANNIRLLMLGSVVTGHATRRSDLDRFLITGIPLGDDPGKDLSLAGRQQLHIESVERATARKFKVRLEGKTFTEREVYWFGKSIGEPNWVSHCVDIQDRFSGATYRRPFDDFYASYRRKDGTIGYSFVPGLRNYSIGFNDLSDNYEIRSLLLANVMGYFENKIHLFEDAGDFNPKRVSDLHRFQRALEIAKAATRKALAVSALEGEYAGGADVTSKSSMLEQVAPIIGRIDHDGRMQTAIELITDLDNEYDWVLDEGLSSGRVKDYALWLHANYLPACAAALFLSRGFYNYANDLSWSDDNIILGDIGEGSEYEDSAGEDLQLKDNPKIKPAIPFLINLAPHEVYDLVSDSLLKRSQGTGQRELALAA